MKRRGYKARPSDGRCTRDVVLRDGSGARCMRPAQPGAVLCWQHANVTKCAICGSFVRFEITKCPQCGTEWER